MTRSPPRTRRPVATTVVEVGVNVPNATVMVVLGGERFGPAQLHPVAGTSAERGAPGRCPGSSRSRKTVIAKERMAAITTNHRQVRSPTSTTGWAAVTSPGPAIRAGQEVAAGRVPDRGRRHARPGDHGRRPDHRRGSDTGGALGLAGRDHSADRRDVDGLLRSACDRHARSSAVASTRTSLHPPGKQLAPSNRRSPGNSPVSTSAAGQRPASAHRTDEDRPGGRPTMVRPRR